MKQKSIIVIVTLFLIFLNACFSDSEEETNDTTPPEIVSLDPVDDATGVDQTSTTITIIFNEPMRDGYSIANGSTGILPTFNSFTWENETTLHIGVTLLSTTEYGLGLNSGTAYNFKDKAGNSLESFEWNFQTD